MRGEPQFIEGEFVKVRRDFDPLGFLPGVRDPSFDFARFLGWFDPRSIVVEDANGKRSIVEPGRVLPANPTVLTEL